MGSADVTIGVVPALNEAGNIAALVSAALPYFGAVVVVDNGSTDETATIAERAGAVVVSEPERGYGHACAAGSAEAISRGAEIIVYLDADLSSVPSESEALVKPILADQADLVLGSRTRGRIERGAMPPHQRFGNWLSARLMRWLYRVEVTDLGPYRAVRSELLTELGMQEMTFGWPTEMMVKAANREARIVEVPVTWRVRHSGESKVSGTLKGSALAARHIIGVTLRYSRLRSREGAI